MEKRREMEARERREKWRKGRKRGGERKGREGHTRHTNPSLLPAPLPLPYLVAIISMIFLRINLP